VEGWSADAGADATADAGYYSFETTAEAYTDAYAEVGYSEASSFSLAAIEPTDHTQPPPPPPPPGDNFDEREQDISNIVLYFDEDDAGSNLDTTPGGGDGFVLVKIDNVPESADDDLDSWLDDVLVFLQTELDADLTLANLLGIAIKGGMTEPVEFFAIDGDPDADSFPAGAPLPEEPPPGGNVPGTSIDHTYDYTDVFV
jgi:hypothetical protein